MHRRLTALAVVALAAVACGGDSGPAPIPAGAPQATSAETTAPAVTGTPQRPSTSSSPTAVPPSSTAVPPSPRAEPPSPAAEPEPEATREPQRVGIDIVDFGYEPAMRQVTVGDTLVWTQIGEVNHTVTFSGGPDSGTLEPGRTYEQRFDRPGTYRYVCAFHSQMRGTITVDG